MTDTPENPIPDDATPNPLPDGTPAPPPVQTATSTPVPPSAGAPLLPPPVPQAATVARHKARSGAVIAAVIGVVAGGGAVAGVLNSARAEDTPTSPAVVITQPAPTAPATPGAGTVPTAVTLPGPSVAPTVSTTPATTPASTPAAPDDTTPGFTPPGGSTPDTAPVTAPNPTPDEAPAVAVAETITMAEGISFGVPEGWTVVTSSEGFAVISDATVSVYVSLFAGATSSSEILFAYQSSLANSISGVELGEIGEMGIASNQIVDASIFTYTGYVGQGQSGSTPVDGVVFGEIRVDGLAIVTDIMYVPESDGSMDDGDGAGLEVFLRSFQYGE